jgi:hypothetical protein
MAQENTVNSLEPSALRILEGKVSRSTGERKEANTERWASVSPDEQKAQKVISQTECTSALHLVVNSRISPSPTICPSCSTEITDFHGHLHRGVYYCHSCFRQRSVKARFKRRLRRKLMVILVAAVVFAFVMFFLWFCEYVRVGKFIETEGPASAQPVVIRG